eukprot:TRINITY_DN31078_c0_g1_i1.p1 TRINITY_DN31078_c0_g1~~TRINITY_DN31078_c0_g1_i1.p1  ORF type:complete len:261 (+),score=62.90 TRINITY_DN31078_c0_g1_i1:34-783(+)
MFRRGSGMLGRAVSQGLRVSAAGSCRLASASMVQPRISPVLQARAGFMSTRQVRDIGQALRKELAGEKAEAEENEELAELVESLSERGFTVRDMPGEAQVTLHGPGKAGEKIKVSFHCQNEVADEDEPGSLEEEHVVDEEDGAAFEMKVEVTKAGNTLAFVCQAADDVYIQSVTYNPAGSPPPADEASDIVYRGPMFEELDSSVQEAFHTYLEERGIDKGLAEFVCRYADEKEQKEYVRWLSNVNRFVS